MSNIRARRRGDVAGDAVRSRQDGERTWPLHLVDDPQPPELHREGCRDRRGEPRGVAAVVNVNALNDVSFYAMIISRVLPVAAVLAALAACGGSRPTEGGPTLVREFTATPIDAGAHPDAFAYRVEAVVLTGENPCIAANSDIRFDRRRENGTVYVTATREVFDPTVVCTREHNPVYEDMTTEVRGYQGDPSAVIVEHVGEMGRQQSLW